MKHYPTCDGNCEEYSQFHESPRDECYYYDEGAASRQAEIDELKAYVKQLEYRCAVHDAYELAASRHGASLKTRSPKSKPRKRAR